MTMDRVELPPLTDERIAAMEQEIFAAITREEADAKTNATRDAATPAHARARRRRRVWAGIGIAASVVLVSAVAVPFVLDSLRPYASGSSTADEAAPGAPEMGREDSDAGGTSADPGTGAEAGDSAESDAAISNREVTVTASATLEVPDATAASEQIASAAQAIGGYVESMSVSADDAGSADAPMSDEYLEGGDVWYPPTSKAWVSVRVPADALDAFTTGLSEFGEVKATQIARDDVTDGARDLRARITALETSVERLQGLIDESASLTELLAAEEALAARQGELEAAKQQLAAIEDRVALSTLTIQLVEPAEVVEADPAGFGDGLTAGWSGFVATLNGIVVAFGFLLPWLVLAGVVVLVVWIVRRRRRAAD